MDKKIKPQQLKSKIMLSSNNSSKQNSTSIKYSQGFPTSLLKQCYKLGHHILQAFLRARHMDNNLNNLKLSIPINFQIVESQLPPQQCEMRNKLQEARSCKISSAKLGRDHLG